METVVCGQGRAGAVSGVVERGRARDYLQDDVALAFFAAREHEAYYLSLKSVDQKRAFHEELKTALLRLLEVATGDGVRLIDEILQRSQPRRPQFTGVVIRLRPTSESEGLGLLGVDENADFETLREAYRTAALRHHPDRGGSNEAMTAVNLAYEQLHASISDRVSLVDAPTLARDRPESGQDYLWSVARLLFEISLDDWALEDAIDWLERLLLARLPDSLGSPPWRWINLIQPSLQLAERLAAAHRREQAQHVICLIEASVDEVKMTELNYNYFAVGLQKTRDVVNGERAPRFVVNHLRQLENAYRLGAIDEKRYASTRSRLEKRTETKAAAVVEEEELLRRTRFIPNLPTDARLAAHEVAEDRLVPEPGYYQSNADQLAPDQQAQYRRTFSDGHPALNLVQKYAWVRLGSLLRSGIHFAHSVDLRALSNEAQTLLRIQPKCDYYADKVSTILENLADLSDSDRRDAVTAIQGLLAPTDLGGGITFVIPTPELSPAFLDEALEISGRTRSTR